VTRPGKNRIEGLSCIRCGAVHPLADQIYTCPACGGNLLVRYDLSAIRRDWGRESLATDPDRSLWRYLPLLPVAGRITAPDVGWTPLVEAPRLARRAHVHRVLVKDDGRNPSASHKDRASAVALVRAREIGRSLVTGASTGNAASATALLAAATEMSARIFVPKTAPRAKIAQLLAFGAEVLAVDGTYDQAFDLCLAATARFGWYNRNTGFNPFTREGKKTVAFEICEQLDWQVPDLVVVSVGDGNILSGVHKGFSEFHQLGFVDRIPRLLAVQATGSASVLDAFEGDGVIRAVRGETVADSIRVQMPRDGHAALAALRESNGFGVRVNDEQILSAIPVLAKEAAVFAEPAGAAAWAGLVEASSQGRIDPSFTVVVLVTGNGLKDVSSVLRAVAREPIPVEPDPSALERLFGSERPTAPD
jgi:threonine synthase